MSKRTEPHRAAAAAPTRVLALAPPALITVPLRLSPGADLRRSLELALADQACEAGFVLAGIGSLGPALIRLAGAEATLRLDEDLELLTLSGSVGRTDSHLHLSVSLRNGQVLGGHAAYGCVVRTTAEVLLAVLPRWRFTREWDAQSGYKELLVRPAAG